MQSGVEMVPSLTATLDVSLETDDAITEGRALGTGCAEVYWRHAPHVGGWSVAVADLEDSRVSIRHTARFEHPPFSRAAPGPDVRMEFAPICDLETRTILSYIEPTDQGGGHTGPDWDPPAPSAEGEEGHGEYPEEQADVRAA